MTKKQKEKTKERLLEGMDTNLASMSVYRRGYHKDGPQAWELTFTFLDDLKKIYKKNKGSYELKWHSKKKRSVKAIVKKLIDKEKWDEFNKWSQDRISYETIKIPIRETKKVNIRGFVSGAWRDELYVKLMKIKQVK